MSAPDPAGSPGAKASVADANGAAHATVSGAAARIVAQSPLADHASAAAPGIMLSAVAAHIVEVGAFGDHAPNLVDIAARQGVSLPAFGRIAIGAPAVATSSSVAFDQGTPAVSPDRDAPAVSPMQAVAPDRDATPAAAPPRPALVLRVRPERWLMLWPAGTHGTQAAQDFAASSAAAQAWSAATAGIGTAVDVSAGLSVLFLGGKHVRELLTRACRLDLDPTIFPAGHVAATHMIQVSVILAALPSGMLLLTPSTTARHVREWVAATAQPFGFGPGPQLTLDDVSR